VALVRISDAGLKRTAGGSLEMQDAKKLPKIATWAPSHNFDGLAEIGPVVWGTPANFNSFRVLAALLHGSQVVGVSQTLRRWTEGTTVFGRATITLDTGAHSIYLFIYVKNLSV